MKLKGSHVLVTGGASGLGEAVVRAAVSAGAAVSVVDLAGSAGAALAVELGSSVRFCPADIVDEASVAAALKEAVEALGPLRAVVQCAGVAHPCRVLSKGGLVHPLAAFEKVLSINLIGTFNVMRLASAIMAKQDAMEDGERGCFVHVASVAAFEGQIGQAAYAASKGGVAAMTLPLARELGDHGIRVNCVAPGIFATPMLAKLPEKAKASLSKQVPFPKRLGHPSEFADCCLHLITNAYYNGMVVRLDGSIRMAAL